MRAGKWGSWWSPQTGDTKRKMKKKMKMVKRRGIFVVGPVIW